MGQGEKAEAQALPKPAEEANKDNQTEGPISQWEENQENVVSQEPDTAFQAGLVNCVNCCLEIKLKYVQMECTLEKVPDGTTDSQGKAELSLLAKILFICILSRHCETHLSLPILSSGV